MSLYKQPGRVAGRTLALVAVAAVLAGLAAGFGLGRATAPDPSLADKLGELRDRLQPARQGIELTATEYSQAVRGGRVVAPTEYKAAQQDVARARGALARARGDLRALSVARAEAVDRATGALAAAVERRVPPAEVARLSRAAEAALAAADGS